MYKMHVTDQKTKRQIRRGSDYLCSHVRTVSVWKWPKRTRDAGAGNSPHPAMTAVASDSQRTQWPANRQWPFASESPDENPEEDNPHKPAKDDWAHSDLTKAQRPGPRDAGMATRARGPEARRRMIRPSLVHVEKLDSCGNRNRQIQ